MVKNEKEKSVPRPHGSVKAWKDGHVFFPENLREELEIGEDTRIPYFINAETVLLTRREMSTEELIAELDALKLVILRRAGKVPENNTEVKK